MPDYTAYVIAVYVLAFLVYGGLTLLWWRTVQAIETRVEQHSRPDSTPPAPMRG